MSEKKNFLEKLYIVFFVAIIGLSWVAWAVVRIFFPSVYEKYSDVSGENRVKTEFDAAKLISSGDMLSSYVDDRVPFRKVFIDKYQKVDSTVEKGYRMAVSKVLELVNGKSFSEKQVENMDDFFKDNQTELPVIENDETTVVAHKHSMVLDTSLKATCEEDGYEIYVCSECGYKELETIPATGHQKILLETSVASYTTYGFKEYICGECGKKIREDFEPKLIDTTYLAPVISGTTVVGRYDWLFYSGNSSISYYRGTNLLDEETLYERKALVDKLYSICEEKGIQLYMMIFPNKEQVYSEYMPSYTIENEYKRVEREVDYINADREDAIIYPLKELRDADAYWQVYCKYDTHWNSMGGFIAVQQLYKRMGMELTNPLTQTVEKVPNSRCDLIALGGFSIDAYPTDYDYIVDYRPEITLHGWNPLQKINRLSSDSDNETKLVMVSDSYREFMAPFMGKDFKESLFLHRDYIASCVDEITSADILVVSAVERYDSRLFTSIERLIAVFEGESINE